MAASDIEQQVLAKGFSSEEVVETSGASRAPRRGLFLVAAGLFAAALICLAGAVHAAPMQKGVHGRGLATYDACTDDTTKEGYIANCAECMMDGSGGGCVKEDYLPMCMMSSDKRMRCIEQFAAHWSPFSDDKTATTR
eukprot:TRINITY_DN978_c0_g1_i18.p2 TRINITY_DN978_c0_g1~~TRINITY_DN978_c0_g1_i18.p2  ORF type:complete len:138 (-),score=39.24 TRINITY_DN978_c0_g1_i18:141-554(-)